MFETVHLKIIVAWKEKNEEILAAVKAEEAKHIFNSSNREQARAWKLDSTMFLM